MSKAGPVLGLIGGLMLLIGGAIVARLGGTLASESAGWTILWGIAAIICGIAGIEGREDGNAVLLIIGIISAI